MKTFVSLALGGNIGDTAVAPVLRYAKRLPKVRMLQPWAWR